MKALSIVAIGAASIMLVSFPAAAQWPPYTPAGVPNTADGKPNLGAPAPRTFDGKPDLSGVWENAGGIGGQPTGPQRADDVPLASFFNVGSGFKDGLPLRPWAADLLKRRKDDNDKDNPDAHCLPMGLLQFHEHPQPRKIVQTPSVIVIIYEANYGLRQIFLDGRRLPDNDAQPWWYGYSVGHWEGDTLVVETTGLRDGGWLDIWGSPLTDAAKITERFRRINYGTLQIDVTIDDSKAYTRPFTVRFDQRLLADGELIEFICNENEQSDRHLLGADAPGTSAAFKFDPKAFDRYVGRYQLAPGVFLTFTREDTHFFGRMPGLPPFEIFPYSDREFFLKAFDARFTFEVDGSGRVTAAVMHTDRDQRAARVDAGR